ncbi:MAG: alkylated DNA repair protein, partial [Bradyrhizobium sp.]|nr:alkylated DNA repair protein [Bradyrhizobium sp.]
MLRRMLPARVVVAALGCAIFWWLTMPVIVAAISLPAYTPDTANGLTAFNAGGCSSCHAVPA